MGKVAAADLEVWSKRKGMLLLNAALTIPKGKKSGAHLKHWRKFLRAVIECLVDKEPPLELANICAIGRDAERVLRGARLQTKPKKGECYYVHPSPYRRNNDRFDETWGEWKGRHGADLLE